MDKNFFRFDIDDEVLMAQADEQPSQKIQETKKESSKASNNENFFCLKGSKRGTGNPKTGYEKQEGRTIQREINPNLFQVDDYINFDFRAKHKKIDIEENQTEITAELSNEIINNLLEDKEVENVVKKAQIGVIFY